MYCKSCKITHNNKYHNHTYSHIERQGNKTDALIQLENRMSKLPLKEISIEDNKLVLRVEDGIIYP